MAARGWRKRNWMKVTKRYKLPVSREISARGVKYSKVNKLATLYVTHEGC